MENQSVSPQDAPEDFPDKLLKFYERRYMLFRHYDKGIKLDDGQFRDACYSVVIWVLLGYNGTLLTQSRNNWSVV